MEVALRRASESVKTVGSRVSQMSLFAMLLTEGVLGEGTTPFFFRSDIALVIGVFCRET